MNQEKEKFQLTNWEIVSVNPADKNWKWTDYFCFWAVNIQSLIGFSLIASLYIIYDLNFLIVLSGSIFASILVYFLSNLIGNLSQKHGIPFPVLLRISIGLNAARYFAMLRGIIGIFFFGVQTFFISKSIVYLIRISFFYINYTRKYRFWMIVGMVRIIFFHNSKPHIFNYKFSKFFFIK